SMTFNEAFSAVTISLDSNVLIFAAVTSLISAALCGLAPSLKASRTDITSNLKDESHGSSGGRSHSRLRTIMVTGQVAVALFLLVGTGILFRGIFLIEHQNLGFRSDHLLTANATLDAIRYKDPEQQTAFIKNLLPVIQKIADAESVAVTSDLPATGPGSVSFQIKGQPESATKQDRNALDIIITPDYLRTARVTLLRGRTFTDFDTATKPRVVMVNEEFVRRYLSDGDPLGKQIRMEIHGTMSDWSEIIGVTGNVKTFSETTLDDPQIYEAYMQRPVSSFSLMVRTTSEPNLLGPNLRKAVSQVDADLPLARVMSMTGVIDRQKAGNPFFVRTLGTFAVLALLLASVGIYGLIAYTVDQRKREIGIRMALGARRSDVRRMILIQGLKLAIIGSAIGLVLALPLPKVFGALFYDLQIRAAWFYIIVPVTILAVSLVAVYVPARRAAQVEPNTALRNE
ncbi:MAG: ABC transporter permease, partial [Acidobacteriia bacterium]|nr:ABC transporter permease [Terriglobia bacterium]